MLVKALREGLGRLIVLLDFVTRPPKMRRGAADQQQAEQAAAGLSLYQFYACPFCVKTRRAIHRLNIPIDFRNAQAGSPHRQALQDQGGKLKVPCLRIDEGETTHWLYESSDIIRYLEQRFGQQPQPGSV